MRNPAHQFAFGLGAGVTGQFLEKVWPGAPSPLYWSLVLGGIALMLWAAIGALKESRLTGLIPNRRISFDEAARLAFERSRKAEIYSGDAHTRATYHAIDLLVDARNGLLQVFGVRPPSTLVEPIPKSWLNSVDLSKDLRSIRNQSHPERIEWDDLCVRRSDLMSHIKRQRRLVASYKNDGGTMSDQGP